MAKVTKGQLKTTTKLLFLQERTTEDKLLSSNKNLAKYLCSDIKEKKKKYEHYISEFVIFPLSVIH